MPRPESILVIRLSSLGDVLMSMPAVKAIREANPGRRVTWLVEGSVGELLDAQPFVDRVIPFPRRPLTDTLRRFDLMGLTEEAGRFVRELRFTSFDVIADFHGIFKSAVLSHAAKGALRLGYGRTFAKEQSHLFYNERIDGPDMTIHKVDRGMLLARRLGANGAVPALQLVTPGHADEYIQDYLRREGLLSPLFAVNPFSSRGSTYKRWGLDCYGDLIGRLGKATGARSIILWGPGEEEEARGLQRLAGEHAVLACPTTVAQLAALLRKMDMYIGGDTGVMHLAAFSGIPVVALFGPTDQRINGPYGTIHRIVRKDVPCSPCKNKTCPDRRCLSGISVDEVLEAVLHLHKGAGNRQ